MEGPRATTRALGVSGTRLTLDGRPFYFQGLSFFNALYNPAFNRNAAERRRWLGVFRANGVNCLRVWCQWDFVPPRAFVDTAPNNSLFTERGEVRAEVFERLASLIGDLDDGGMVLELCLFANEREPYFLPISAQERATRELTERLRPYRNLILQIWNEHSAEVLRYFKVAKSVDPDRLVTSSPGFAIGPRAPFDHLGDDAANRAFDILTPHTQRSEAVPFWYVAPAQVEYLLNTYGKPVIDDEPARSGPVQFGGLRNGTRPEQHVEHIRRTRAVGGYHTYHHDMFQYGYGHELTPPSGIPDPGYSPFHRQAFDYLREHISW